MKVVICSNVYPPHFIGGAELVAHYQALALVRLGHEVSVYAGDSMLEIPRHHALDTVHDGIPVRRIRLTAEDFSTLNVTFCHPAVEADFEAFVARERPDVVHFHNVNGLSIKIIAIARESGARTVVTLHDYWGFCFKNTAMRTAVEACRDFDACGQCQSHIDDGDGRRIPMRMRQDIFRLVLGRDVDAFVSPSRALADTYLRAGFAPSRMHVVWNGIDAERFGRIARQPLPEAVRFSFFGYLGWHKGIHTLVDALALLPDPTRARVNFVGDGDLRNACRDAAASSGCGHLVRFWGKVPNDRIEEAYRQTDVVVLPSMWRENQSVSITEAMAAGIPVIASNMGGNAELVRHGHNGFLFESGDANALAAAMQRFIDAPVLLAEMGARGREIMHRFTFDSQAARLLAIYRSCGAAPPPDPVEPVVACSGTRFPQGATVLHSAVEQRARRAVRFVHEDWLTRRQLLEARARWDAEAADDALDAVAEGLARSVT